jgi:hypothetical protein
VFDGGAGETKGGRDVRSIDSGDLERFFDRLAGEEEAVAGGESVMVVSIGDRVVGLEVMVAVEP